MDYRSLSRQLRQISPGDALVRKRIKELINEGKDAQILTTILKDAGPRHWTLLRSLTLFDETSRTR